MTYIQIYLLSLILIQLMMALLWLVSVPLKNVSIVDPFWGLGFVIVSFLYFFLGEGFEVRKILILIMVTIWGLRLSIFLFWRNSGKGEDFRYKQFRKDYGEKKYWWISYFQVFLLQGFLMWLISAPLLAAQFYGHVVTLGWLDFLGIFLWVIGLIFEAGGDFQLTRFKSDPENKGKVLDSGFWHYTRHPNYFGDAAVWWGYACISMAAGSFIPVLGSILMTILIIKVSGVTLLEKTLKNTRPRYTDYVRKTSAFIPWFPKKNLLK
jgi:steroid 5-alpha reductase family enzyme